VLAYASAIDHCRRLSWSLAIMQNLSNCISLLTTGALTHHACQQWLLWDCGQDVGQLPVCCKGPRPLHWSALEQHNFLSGFDLDSMNDSGPGREEEAHPQCAAAQVIDIVCNSVGSAATGAAGP
jgi:hypothetical protein